MRLMHTLRREIVGFRKMEGQIAIGNQRQPLPVGRMDGIDHLRLAHLFTHIVGQICHGHRPDIDDTRPALRETVE